MPSYAVYVFLFEIIYIYLYFSAIFNDCSLLIAYLAEEWKDVYKTVKERVYCKEKPNKDFVFIFNWIRTSKLFQNKNSLTFLAHLY